MDPSPPGKLPTLAPALLAPGAMLLRTDYVVHRADMFTAGENIFHVAPHSVLSSVHSEKLATGIVAHLSGIARIAQEFGLRRGDTDDLAVQRCVGLRDQARAFEPIDAPSRQSEQLTPDTVEFRPNPALARAHV